MRCTTKSWSNPARVMRQRTITKPSWTTSSRQHCAGTDVNRSLTAEIHQQFDNNVAGEWRGSMCTFNAKGEKVSLPHLYIPDAYKEWGMEMYDWQTHCSMSLEEGVVLEDCTKKLYSATGCECDSIASEKHHQRKLEMHQFNPNGSYFCSSENHIEACFRPEDSTERQRIVIHATSTDDLWHLQSIDLYNERYVGAFGSDVDITDYGSRVPDVSSTSKTTIDQDTLQALSSLSNLTPREASMRDQMLQNPTSILPLHSTIFLFTSPSPESLFLLLASTNPKPLFCIYGFMNALHFSV